MLTFGCSSALKTKSQIQSTSCVQGEGIFEITSSVNNDRIPVSFKRNNSRWLFGAEIPLRGEEVFIIGQGGLVSKNLRKPLQRIGASELVINEMLRRIFPVSSNIREEFVHDLGSRLELRAEFDQASLGSFKLTLMKNYFFIKKTYGKLKFRVLDCDKRENFQILKI